MQNTDPRPLRWAPLPTWQHLMQWRINAMADALNCGYGYGSAYVLGLGSLDDVVVEYRHRERDLLLAGMEARYQVRGGLEHTDVETLDAAVQQTMADADLMDLTRAEAAMLAAALIRGYACANPVASARDREHAARRQGQRDRNTLRRFTRRMGWAWAAYRAAVLDMAERLNALARDDETERLVRIERTRSRVAAGILHEPLPNLLGGDFS